MYINAVANSVMLYIELDFYNIIFKIKHNLYVGSLSPTTTTPHPTAPGKIPGRARATSCTGTFPDGHFICGRETTTAQSLQVGIRWMIRGAHRGNV
jgi:hypothetical protein